MIVLGIDPGYDRLGVALINKEGNKEELLFSTCLTTIKSQSLGQRLLDLGNELESLLSQYKPDIIATEKLFFSINQKTALQVAEARGLISYLAAKHNIPMTEYAPGEIKLTIAGYGNANKKQVTDMVKRLIKVDKEAALDDEYDAIAIALTHLAIHPH